MEQQPYHVPALLQEAIDGLNIKPSGTYADATFGGGGHSRAILERLGENGHLYSFDRDMDAWANRIDDPRFTFVHSNFRYMHNFMRFYDIDRFDGILADLGVSFHHFDQADRGFSFRADAPLDMRMDQKSATTAADIVNSYDRERLTEVLRAYTDLRQASQIARAITEARSTMPIDTTTRLAESVARTLNPRQEKKDLAQIFQALRIETNGEMDDLRHLLESTLKTLRPGGRLAVLTYHSIEDRMVKNFMRSGNPDGNEEKDFFGRISTPWKIITRSPLTASAEEVIANP
ncbi:MAG: 16S rRNA (cytosine(1402)-N(4))-methyltransferase RsmH, partial [Muribaculaceae bacterium]|nr:16S rRNA (cytosine(1402)-N(4))-methyltransferase RsmH [Muribaculaceae bacterium]